MLPWHRERINEAAPPWLLRSLRALPAPLPGALGARGAQGTPRQPRGPALRGWRGRGTGMGPRGCALSDPLGSELVPVGSIPFFPAVPRVPARSCWLQAALGGFLLWTRDLGGLPQHPEPVPTSQHPAAGPDGGVSITSRCPGNGRGCCGAGPGLSPPAPGMSPHPAPGSFPLLLPARQRGKAGMGCPLLTATQHAGVWWHLCPFVLPS